MPAEFVVTGKAAAAIFDGNQISGESWEVLGQGLPRIIVTDLVLHRATRTLRAGTFGRGMWDLPLKQ